MRSPFPGVDPYLQRYWSDIRSSVVPAIQPRLPAGLRAQSEERVILKESAVPAAEYRPDVAVITQRTGGTRRPTRRSSALAVADPAVVVVEFFTEPEVDRYVQVIDTRDGDRVVTAVELLSPRNKAAGDASRDYQRKVRDYARAGVNVVEIDLIRGPRTRLRVRHGDLPPG